MKLSRTAVRVVILLLAGCRDSGPSSGLRVVQMPIGSRTFKLEVADTSDVQNVGLMKRDSMPEDRGMIFVFKESQRRNFWMRNVRFPLDIIFMDSSGKIVSIKQMKPYDESSVPSDASAQFAIELNKGAAAATGVKVGDTLRIPPEISAPP